LLPARAVVSVAVQENGAAYRNAAAKESVFMLALRDVAEAHKISRVAVAARVNRERRSTRRYPRAGSRHSPLWKASLRRHRAENPALLAAALRAARTLAQQAH